MMTFSWQPDTVTRAEAISRFQKTGGLPSEGTTLLGRWTNADFSGGYDLLESDNAESLTEFALMWSDLMEIKIFPVLEDNELSNVLNKITP